MRWSSGDYQIAPKPPGGRLWLVAADAAGVWGTPPAGGTGDEGHLIRHGFAAPPVSLRVGRSAGLTGHRPVIQYREPPQGEGFFRPGALLLALFISFCLFIAFWRCRSGRSETGVTGRRRGLRRGRRSWGPRWAAPRAGRSSSRRFGVFPPTWPADAGDASPAY